MNGDGQSRTGGLAIAADGTRTLVPWTDVAGYGTIAQVYGIDAFGQGGDYFPPGSAIQGTAVAAVGSRWLAISSSESGLFAADVTSLASMTGSAVRNGIPSEAFPAAGTSLTRPVVVKSAGRTLVVFQRQGTTPGVGILDVSNPGPSVPGLTSSFGWRDLTLSDLGAPPAVWLERVAAAAHPSDGALHLLLEYKSQAPPFGVSSFAVKRIDTGTGAVTTVGSFAPASDAATPQAEIHLVPFDADLVAVATLYSLTHGGTKLQIRALSDLSRNLAEAIPTLTDPAAAQCLAVYRGGGDGLHLYLGLGYGHWALSLGCDTTPVPPAPTRFQPLTPCRVADTREGAGVPLAAGELRDVPVTASACGVPADAVSAAFNVTVTEPAAAGHVTVFPAGSETPLTLTTAFAAGRTRAAPTIVALGAGGAVRVFNASPGTVHVVLDVSGVFR